MLRLFSNHQKPEKGGDESRLISPQRRFPRFSPRYGFHRDITSARRRFQQRQRHISQPASDSASKRRDPSTDLSPAEYASIVATY